MRTGRATTNDLYRELIALRADVGRALIAIEVLQVHNTDADKSHADQETRIRLLERFRYTLGGLSVIGGTLAGWLGYLLGHAIH
jgi:hypothetical protein